LNGRTNEIEGETRANYNVLYTDYNNVALVYSCKQKWWMKQESAYVLTRDWNISASTIDGYEAKLKELIPAYGGSL
jgi:hypothetical protein